MEIELPDGTILEAPDGSDASVVAKNYLRQQRIRKIVADNPSEYDHNSPEWQAKYGATSGMSGTQKFMAGAGKSVVDTGRGIKQLGLGAADLIAPRQQGLSDLITGKPQSRYQQYAQQIDEQNRLDAPLMQTGAGLLGNVAGSIATTLAPAGLLGAGAKAAGLTRTAGVLGQIVNPTTYKAAAATGAALGALQPVGQEGSRLMNAGLGAAGGLIGQGISRGISRLTQPVQSATPEAVKRSADVLRKAGVPLDAAQQTGSTRLAQVKRFLTDNPLTAGGQKAQFERTATGFDRAALATIGEKADVATPEVMNRAATRIGGLMDDVAEKTNVTLDRPLISELQRIQLEAGKRLDDSSASVIQRNVNEIFKSASPVNSMMNSSQTLPGNAFQRIFKDFGGLRGSPNGGISDLAGQARTALEDALQRSASVADREAYKAARVQWRNLEGIQKVIGSQEGQHISPARLANALNQKAFGGKVAMVRGKGATDLMRLAKAGSTIIPDRFPNSGTPARAALQLLAPGAIGAGYGYAKEGDLSGAAKFAVGGALTPLMLQRLLNTPGGARYLANGIPGISAGGLSPALRYAPAAGLIAAGQQ